MIAKTENLSKAFGIAFVSAMIGLFTACSNERIAPVQTVADSERPQPTENELENSAQVASQEESPTSEESTAEIAEEPAPKTAEALLARINAGLETDQWSELDALEAAKTVKILRERYPFDSIRERLSFQKQEPIRPPKESGRGAGTRFNRPASLEALHSEEVEAFINRPGFGFDRGPRPNPYDLKMDGPYVEHLISRPVDSELLGEPVVALPEYVHEPGKENMKALWSLSNGMPNSELPRIFHLLINRGFASPDSNGYIRDLDNVAGFQSHRIRFAKEWDGSLRMWDKAKLAETYPGVKELDVNWRVNRLQLVSLLIHDTPRVYISEKLPDMEELNSSNAQTRPINGVETNGLDILRRGEDIYTIATPNRIVMLGAIRADNDCLNCHSVKKDELLGAFSYELLREPRLDLNPAPF